MAKEQKKYISSVIVFLLGIVFISFGYVLLKDR